MKVLIFLLLISMTLFPKTSINWNLINFPPFSITEGEYKKQGINDLILDYYIKELSEYEHKLTVTNLQRLLQNSKNQSHFATNILLYNEERSEFLYFTKPFDFTLTNHLIILEKNFRNYIDYINDEGYINFEELMKNNNFKISIKNQRFYSDIVNATLNTHENSNKIDLYYGDEILPFVMKLQRNRIDAFIEYPAVLSFTLEQNKIDLDYIAIPILGLNKYNLSRFSVSKNPWGKHLIEKLNLLIDSFVFTKEYEEIALKWSEDKEKYLEEFRNDVKNEERLE